jgi:hypothetical protein
MSITTLFSGLVTKIHGQVNRECYLSFEVVRIPIKGLSYKYDATDKAVRLYILHGTEGDKKNITFTKGDCKKMVDALFAGETKITAKHSVIKSVTVVKDTDLQSIILALSDKQIATFCEIDTNTFRK